MPVSNKKTLRDLLEIMAHTIKFKENANLFINKEQLQEND